MHVSVCVCVSTCLSSHLCVCVYVCVCAHREREKETVWVCGGTKTECVFVRGEGEFPPLPYQKKWEEEIYF